MIGKKESTLVHFFREFLLSQLTAQSLLTLPQINVQINLSSAPLSAGA